MPRSQAPPSISSRDAAVLAAIAAAEKRAGRDNKTFVDELNRQFRASMQKTTRARGAAPSGPHGPDESFHIYEDPRYLANARELARRTRGGSRVMGGSLVRGNEFLDCVAVGNDAQWGCTGTLIAPNVVLTAGHCAEFATRVFFGNDVSNAGKIVKVRKRVRHPKYRQGAHNDLMVLLLAEKVTTVKPRALATKKQLDSATDGRVVGFGATEASGTFGYGVKRFVDVPIASSACRGKVNGREDRFAYGCDPGLELIAGRPLLERDSCKGDSGGPIYLPGKNEQWVLGGATSRATDSAMSVCGDGGVYARADRYRAWIDSIPGVSLP